MHRSAHLPAFVIALSLAIGACDRSATEPTATRQETITVTPGPAAVFVGGTLQLTATLADSAGNPIDSSAAFTWSSSDESSASVSGTGLVRGLKPNDVVRITVSSGPVKVVTGLVSIAVKKFDFGDFHGCFLSTTGWIYCWGKNASGELGNSEPTPDTSLVPTIIVGGNRYKDLTVGSSHACGLTDEGRAYCWGSNFYGAIGRGTSGNNQPSPVSVGPGATQPIFKRISAGRNHTCGVATDDRILCWGSGFAALPTTVTSSVSIDSISTGIEFACGLAANGAAFCFGENARGQLGNGTQLASASPGPVSGGLTFRMLDAGMPGSQIPQVCGVTTASTGFCWGLLWWRADQRQVHVPEQVPGNLSFRTLALGTNHLCGLTFEKRVYCIGYGGNGEMAEDPPRSSWPTHDFVPVRPAEDGTIEYEKLFAGNGVTCVVTDAGTPYCWGYWARLPNGNDITARTPKIIQPPIVR